MLGQTGIENLGICTAAKAFFMHSSHIVTGIAEQYFSVATKVLIQLEPSGHPPNYADKGTMRSRASSAA